MTERKTQRTTKGKTERRLVKISKGTIRRRTDKERLRGKMIETLK